MSKDVLFDLDVHGTIRSFAALQVLNRRTLHLLSSCGRVIVASLAHQSRPLPEAACALEHLQRLEDAARKVLRLPLHLRSETWTVDFRLDSSGLPTAAPALSERQRAALGAELNAPSFADAPAVPVP